MNQRVPPQFVIKLRMRDGAGQVTGTREFVTYPGLLAIAHDHGLSKIATTLLQAPTQDNGRVAIVSAVARGKAGTFAGLGDASPENVNRTVGGHLVRVAETRAKARALRDMTNVAMVAFEELGGDDNVEVHTGRTPTQQAERKPRLSVAHVPATDAQRAALRRKARALGVEGDSMAAFFAERFGSNEGTLSKAEASRLLSELDFELRARQNQRLVAAE